MKDSIIEVLKNSNKALSEIEICDRIPNSNLEEICVALYELQNEYKIRYTKKGKYEVDINSNVKIGTLIGNRKGFGFVDIEGTEDVFVSRENMNGAIHGDQVAVEITHKKGTDLEGRIVSILKRDPKNIVGEFFKENNKNYVIPDDDKLSFRIVLDDKDSKNLVDGHKVVVSLGKKIDNRNYNGYLLKIIGHKNDPKVDILSIAMEHDIDAEFPKDVIEELDSIPSSLSEQEIKNRLNNGGKDLRDKVIFTIDGDDTKDIDDAISIKKLNNGNFELGVHIADVSHYVKKDSPLDKEALKRGTSVYLADTVIPMLPHKLSNGICSLNPNEDRLAISCVMEIDNNGNTISSDIFKSIIKSRKQMTYKNVNKILEDNIIPEGYEEYVEDLKLMKELSSILRKNKVSRGYIDFDIDESKIIVDSEGKPIDVKLRYRGIGENMIEDFMIASNEATASTIFYMDLPYVYRVHGTPDEEKIENFLRFISILGYKVNGKIKNITPLVMQDILNQLKEKKEYKILSRMCLRCMRKAVYDTNNIGHFGLGSKIYCHETSPIRRYPDLTVHRLLKDYLFNHKLDPDYITYLEKTLPVIAEHSSKKERDSVECEREVDDMKKAEYMMDHIGEIYEGMINSVMSFGMFVELPNLIEGRVSIESMKDDIYTFDEKTYSIVGKKNKRGYRLGDNVLVKVVAANKKMQTIDFEIVKGDKSGNSK